MVQWIHVFLVPMEFNLWLWSGGGEEKASSYKCS